jgi:hypothetical protein
MANLSHLGRVQKIFDTEVQYHKLLKTGFDAFGCALSNETTFKLFYRAEMINLSDLRGHALCKMVHGTHCRTEVDMGQFFVTRPDPTYLLFNPTRAGLTIS